MAIASSMTPDYTVSLNQLPNPQHQFWCKPCKLSRRATVSGSARLERSRKGVRVYCGKCDGLIEHQDRAATKIRDERPAVTTWVN